MTEVAAVAGPNAFCTQAGAQVARAGGNAVDVAVAATLAALVTEPGIASLGGGAFVTVGGRGREGVTVDGSVSMPGSGLPRGAFGRGLRPVHLDYGGGIDLGAGHGSVATPGALTAFEHSHRRYGRLPWAWVVRPAAGLAREGFTMGRTAANYLHLAAGPLFGSDPEARAVLTGPDGRRLGEGDTVLQPALADFLDLVARDGAAAMHRGEVAKRIAVDMADHGGLLTEADLADYRPVERPALTVQAGAWRWATPPPPSVGGGVLAAMLVLFHDLLGHGEAIAAHGAGLGRLLAVQRAVLSHRVRELDVAPDRTAAAAKLLAAVVSGGARWLATSPSTATNGGTRRDWLAWRQGPSGGCGAGVSAPGTGVWLNNCLGERELNRGGLHASAPGERIVSNMSPTVGLHADGTVLAIGSPGADRIASAIAQVVLGLIGGDPLGTAIARPRVHVTCADDGRPVFVDHEADLPVPAGAAADLRRREHPPLSMFFGGVAAAALTGAGTLEAASDPRREGAVAVVAGEEQERA